MMVCWGVGSINNGQKHKQQSETIARQQLNRNTPYFNHTRSTVNKVSTNLVQTAELVCSPTPWRAALGTSSSVQFVTHFINSTNH